MAPLTPLQRLVAKLLPWFDPKEQEDRIAHTEAIRRRSIRARISAERLVRADRLGSYVRLPKR